MRTIKKKIKKNLSQIIEKIFEFDVDLNSINLDYSSNDFADFCSTISFVLVKKLKKNPKEIAEKIVNNFNNVKDDLEKVVATNGFINFYLSDVFWSKFICNSFVLNGPLTPKKKKINIEFISCNPIEFISCNPTGPATIANGRGGYLGDVIANLFEFFGFCVEREFFLNDSGNQVLTLGKSIIAIKNGEKIEDNMYQGKYLEKIANEINTDNKNAKEIGELVADKIFNEMIKPSIKKMGIKFDTFFSERTMRNDGKIKKILAYLKKKNLVYKKDGAEFVKTKNFGDEKDRVIVKSDGNYTYFLMDIAYHKIKLKKSDKIITILGADHHGAIPSLKAIIKLFKRENDANFLITQNVGIIAKGEKFKMSKRKGKFIKMDNLLDDIDIDSIRWFFLQRTFNTHLDFNVDLAMQKDQKNPVFYFKYAYARVSSILEKIDNDDCNEKNFNFDKYEKSLLLEILKFENILSTTIKTFEVHKLCFFALSLSEKFHKFYSKCNVINANKKDKTKRIKILFLLKKVFEDLAKILGIKLLKKM